MPDELCFCGQPLHYSDPKTQADVQLLIDMLGPRVPVTAGDRTWLVPRHYIALHGIKAAELPLLGFDEIQLSRKPSGPRKWDMS